MVDGFLTRMYWTDPGVIFTVTCDFLRTCPTPVLFLPDDVHVATFLRVNDRRA